MAGPGNQPPYQTPYERIGGEAGVRNLVKVFYDLVETEPEGAPLRVMHNQGNGLAHARDAQFMFLSGFLGGPQLYVEQHHHSNVRQMHAHLEIGPVEAQSWLACMEKALEQTADDETRRLLMQTFTRVANALKNRPQDADNPLKVTSA
ncbi:group II truncated hemoglobin [Aestuariivirga sp.]|uniref:group II truncated hemoglobin n=1 Tax=Aestuariivirga sp. TaxID=2650926 RepID=UPI003593A7B2